ncbi:replication factor-a protein [Neocallimastix lanati (nom. inval.)]|jgi:replication factor A1|uniref:Replication protein A subunit n=1 Tax=Neocallimastix californiae TaxID=1754190 RepID=A0A1Y2DRU1_9FUNG|nr:replication factor-a protein [Neocallimastix sp. JGI-2020a]ORY61991.1 replication factor-a protein [Neocallimastix californiae]|eukprot:ORY61991.1 replication factor-a protein [Neocallimastix californiae]
MAAQLTRNFIEALYRNEYQDFENPVVQVLNVKTTKSNTHRVIISDGIYFMQTLMSSQLLEQSSRIKKNTLIKIKKCISNRIQNNSVVSIFGILLDFDVLPYENLDKIGNPKNIQEVIPPSTVNGYSSNNPISNNNNNTVNNNNNNSNNVKNNNFNNKNNNNGNNMNNNPNVNIFPIKSLSPYQNRWTIRAKAINKSPIKQWSNARGTGKLFSVILMDDSSEIKVTAFNEACDRFHEIIQEGQMYYISGGSIRLANKRFNSCNNEYEMTLDQNSNVTLCNDNSDEPKIHYSFIPLDQLMNIEKDSIIDVIGVVDQVGDIVQLISKTTNKPIQKRDIFIVDDTGYKVKLTLWNNQAEETKYEDRPVVAFKAVKVNDFGGKSLSSLSASIISFNPDIRESHRITGWYSQNGGNFDFKTYSNLGTFNGGDVSRINTYKTLQQITNENLGTGEKPDYFSSIATIVYIKKDNFCYPACPSEGCNKKVSEEEDGWRCEKCSKTYPQPDYRYILNIDVLDHTGNQWLTCFNEVSEKLIGHKAQELKEIKDRDETEFNRIIEGVILHKYDFNIRAKVDNYNDEVRLRCNVIGVKPINYEIQIKNDINSIDKLMNELQI